MKNILRGFSFIILFSILILESFAIEAPANLKADSSDNNSVILSWDNVDWAYMYYAQYSKNSWIDWVYENTTEYTETNSISINNLEEGSTYYFSVIAIDEEWEKSIISNEVAIDIIQEEIDIIEGQDVDFILDWVKVISSNIIELSFSAPIKDWSDVIREFKIINKADAIDSFEVISNKLNSQDSSKLLITLDKEFEIWNEYEVVVLAITSLDGKNIESWIDSIQSFVFNGIIETVDSEITDSKLVELDSSVELNSASELIDAPSGKTTIAENMENTALVQAANTSSLPKTWPEHIFMLILSIVLGVLVFVFKYKKA